MSEERSVNSGKLPKHWSNEFFWFFVLTVNTPDQKLFKLLYGGVSITLGG